MSEIIEKKKGTFELINTCQQILGKVFNAQETAIIRATQRPFNIVRRIHAPPLHPRQADEQAVSAVVHDNSLRFTFSTTTLSDTRRLRKSLNLIEERVPFESYVRELFGIGKRALIPKEKEFIGSVARHVQVLAGTL